MSDHPIRDPKFQADIEAKSRLLVACATAGKLTVEFYMKDGKWAAGQVTFSFPRSHERRGT